MPRPPGSPNKVSSNAKACIEAVFEKRGGVPAMLEWSNENPTEFYKIFAKLLPASMKVDLVVRHTIHRNFTGRTLPESTETPLIGPESDSQQLPATLVFDELGNTLEVDTDDLTDE